MYFLELHEKFIAHWWYQLGRGIVAVLLGSAALVLPDATAHAVLYLMGVGFLMDALILMLPVLLGKTTRHLWRIVFTKGLIEFLAAIFLFSHTLWAVDIFAVLVGLLLMFRGVLEFISFVEVDTTVNHQRIMFISSIFSFLLGGYLIVQSRHDAHAAIILSGIYTLVEGVLHMANAWRVSETYQIDGVA